MSAKIFIIGNGFDLNLGFPTSYTDYIKSSEYKKLTGQNNKLAIYLQDTFSGRIPNWVDIELELHGYTDKDEVRNDQAIFSKEFIALKTCLINYLKGINYTETKNEAILLKLLRDNVDDNSAIINFNYTPTVVNALKSLDFKDELINRMHLHMHGKVDHPDRIIFGAHDNIGAYPIKSLIRKSEHDHYNTTDIRQLFNNAEEIYILGHSLGMTDEDYFNEAFFDFTTNRGNKKLTWTYHGEDSKSYMSSRIVDLARQRMSHLRRNIESIPINTKLDK